MQPSISLAAIKNNTVEAAYMITLGQTLFDNINRLTTIIDDFIAIINKWRN